MRILVTAAEDQELQRAIKAYNEVKQQHEVQAQVDFHLTGIGAVQACHRVTKEIMKGIIENILKASLHIKLNFAIIGSVYLLAF